MEKENPCRGCLLIDPGNFYICLVSESKLFEYTSEKCPCKTCLIKGMCGVVCDQFLKYIADGFCCGIEELNKLKGRFPIALNEERSRIDILIILQYLYNNKNIEIKGDPRKWKVVDISEKIKIKGKINEREKRKYMQRL